MDNLQHWSGDFARLLKVQFTNDDRMSRIITRYMQMWIKGTSTYQVPKDNKFQ